jgi:DNA mismatch repair protein MutL
VSAIRRLPETLVNRIAAGEVVERPASALKELVENAIDASARRIDIVLRDGGQTLISVADDGCGMSGEELRLAVERHATSKLPDDDLSRIASLGFRGEALPSIGAVARLTLTSRRASDAHAAMLAVEGGRVGDVAPAAHPCGTRVEVRDLFYATPARLKFLKSPPTEQAHALDAVERLAVAHAEVSFRVGTGERTLLDLPAAAGQQARLARITKVLGRDFAENALPVDAERDAMRLGGFAGLPTFSRRSGAKQFLVVNGRPVRDRLLQGALRAAYSDLMPADRQPLAALFLDLPAAEVDVNVHPMKTEVRFRDAGAVRGLIIGALKRALAAAGHRAATTVAYSLLPGRGTSGSAAIYPHVGRSQPSPGLADAAARYHLPLAPPALGPTVAEACPGASAEADPETATGIPPLGFARAQLLGTFIIAQAKDGIVIVDQHAAHERLVHERLKRQIAAGRVPRQALLIPEVVELDEAAAARIIARAADLAGLGVVVEPFGPRTVVIREVPALLQATSMPQLIRDLADDLAEWGEAIALGERFSERCGTIACHGSVRAGRKLTIEEMNALLRDMEATPHAGQCSHGRPTFVHLDREAIERLFGRR